MKQRLSLIITVATVSILTLGTVGTLAATTTDSKLSQTINAGTISTYFADATNAPIAAPTFAMTAPTITTGQNLTSTGTFGTNTQRVMVDNPGVGLNGFSLALAATNATIGWYGTGATGVQAYKHNGGTPGEGQLSITSAGTTAAVTGGTTGISGAVPGTFDGSTASITLMTGSAASADIWKGYVQGIGLSQVIPSSVPAGSYAIDLTQTVTAF